MRCPSSESLSWDTSTLPKMGSCIATSNLPISSSKTKPSRSQISGSPRRSPPTPKKQSTLARRSTWVQKHFREISTQRRTIFGRLALFCTKSCMAKHRGLAATKDSSSRRSIKIAYTCSKIYQKTSRTSSENVSPLTRKNAFPWRSSATMHL